MYWVSTVRPEAWAWKVGWLREQRILSLITAEAGFLFLRFLLGLCLDCGLRERQPPPPGFSGPNPKI